MTQVSGHASVNLGCVAPQASEAVGALCSSMIVGKGNCGSSAFTLDLKSLYLFIYFFWVHYPQVFEPSQLGEISYSLLKC